MINILYTSIDEEQHEKLLKSFLPNFSPDFQDKIRKYRRWQDAQLSLLGRVLLKKGMEQFKCSFNESDLQYTDFSKPYLKSSNINFNISHSGDYVICALTDLGEVGIDIEKISPIEISGFKSQMTPNEWNSISKAKNIQTSFFKYWTQKEAVIKALGKGLTIPLKSFEVNNNKTVIEDKIFYVSKIDIENGYTCHLASQHKINTETVFIKEINTNTFITI